MNQILHIFKKDARHLWPEILVSLAITVAFVRITFETRSNFIASRSPYLPIVAALITALVPVAWWVLAARLIFDESLVGEGQFWITRPYQWKKLLAAKALFLLAFLYLPIFIAQVVLLAAAGFHPFAYLPGLFYNLILITGVLILPIAAIATVTSNFSRLILTVLGVVVYLALILWMLTFFSPSDQFGFENPYAGKFTFALSFFIFLLVIVLQYATRHTWRSRWLLLGLPFLAIACNVAWPIQTVVRHLYPPLTATAQSPVQLTFDPHPERQNTVDPSHERSRVDLYLPLTVSGVSPGFLIRNQAVQVSIEAPNGPRWTSKWQKVSTYYRPDRSQSFIDVPINENFLGLIKATPVIVTLNFALVELRAGATVTNQAGNLNFSAAGGICSVSDAFGTYPECRFAMGEPGLTSVSTYWTEGPCSQSPPSPTSGTLGSVWIGDIDSSPAEIGLDPVKVKPLLFSNQPQDMRHSSFICRGTPVTTTPYSVVRRIQTTLTVPNLDLTKYTIDRLDRTMTGGFRVRTR
jgi:hypothetical protein